MCRQSDRHCRARGDERGRRRATWPRRFTRYLRNLGDHGRWGAPGVALWPWLVGGAALGWSALALLGVAGVPLLPGVFNWVARKTGAGGAGRGDADAVNATHTGGGTGPVGARLAGGRVGALAVGAGVAGAAVVPSVDGWLRCVATMAIAYVAGFLFLTAPGGLGVARGDLVPTRSPASSRTGRDARRGRGGGTRAGAACDVDGHGGHRGSTGVGVATRPPARQPGDHLQQGSRTRLVNVCSYPGGLACRSSRRRGWLGGPGGTARSSGSADESQPLVVREQSGPHLYNRLPRWHPHSNTSHSPSPVVHFFTSDSIHPTYTANPVVGTRRTSIRSRLFRK